MTVERDCGADAVNRLATLVTVEVSMGCADDRQRFYGTDAVNLDSPVRR